MTDRPINFRPHQVRAALEGRLSQHRVVLKPQPDTNRIVGAGEIESGVWVWQDCVMRPVGLFYVPFAAGDRLWVRETWKTRVAYDDLAPADLGGDMDIQYLADNPLSPWFSRTRSALHMPRWASRLTLTVTNVKVQRLHDISEEDARTEGCAAYGPGLCTESPDDYFGCYSARTDFCHLWNSIHGPDAWDKNPWVAALTFTVTKANIDAVR